MKFTADALMSDLIHDDYRLLQVISRFGVSLGFGNQTIAEACAAAEVDIPTFLAVVNFVLSGGAMNVNEVVPTVSVKALLSYLQQSHTYFVDFRLPAIRRKLIEAINCSSHNQISFLILKFYDEYAAEVQRHMEYENTHIHTYVQQLIEGRMPAEAPDYASLARQHEDNHSTLSKSSEELKSVMVKYYPSDSDTLQLSDTLMDLYIMEEDLFSHCLLEDTLFAQAVARLEHDIRQRDPRQVKGKDPVNNMGFANGEELSEREKEVIRLVVQGLSNKEIAEQMFISVNTVMTHRRNIVRKTQIHSAAALTIFAIVNGLVNLEDVKM